MSVAASEDNAVDGRIIFELLRVNRLVVNVYLFIVPLNISGLSSLPQDLRTEFDLLPYAWYYDRHWTASLHFDLTLGWCLARDRRVNS